MIVLSLGGSLINPGTIDIPYLKKFRDFILNRKEKFIVVCGGGDLARKYIDAAVKLSGNKNQDWLGIQTTLVNANLLREVFDLPHGSVLMQPRKVHFAKVLCASGWKPGFSTDACAVEWAKKNRVSAVFNLTNVDQVFDKDPKKFKNAKPINWITWDDYLKLIGEWRSGLHAPFDPVASRKAKQAGVDVYVLNGRKLNNLADAIGDKDFVGTVIS